MTDKELAYKLYNMKLDEKFVSDNFEIYIRVIGGWVLNNKVFIPWNNEFQKYAYEFSNKTKYLACPICGRSKEYKLHEKYQSNEYKCAFECRGIIIYNNE